MLVTLVQNAALLLAMVVVFDLVTSRKRLQGQRQFQALAGVILGGLCISLMGASYRLESGIIFDTRSVLLSISGLFLGPIPTFFSMAMAAAYRLWLGGKGAWTGISVILATGGIGILWHRCRRGRLDEISVGELYGFGVAAHLVMLAVMLTLPWEAARRVLADIGPPVLLVYPVATVALGWLAVNRLRREKAAAALEWSEGRFRQLFKVAPIPLALSDKEGTVSMVNDRWEKTFGYAREEIPTTEDWLRLAYPDPDYRRRVIDTWENSVRRARETNRDAVEPHEYRVVCKNGDVRTLEITGTFIQDDLLVVFYDITDRIAAERELRRLYEQIERDRRALLSTLEDKHRAETEILRLNMELERRVMERTAQLEASNKELEAFSYSVSHDLRAPLRHISGYADLLNKRFREALPEKARHYLGEITASARHMEVLIDDLLQFSRIGRQEVRRTDVDMNALVRDVMEKLQHDTKERNLSWVVGELPRTVGDPVLLERVWTNLLENAVKYTRNKAEATIELGCTREPDHWVFFVRDNGAGFDMRYAHKLFGIFQRLHSQADFEGTGIGLANVQRIVHKHGGRVWAEGRPGEGAAFYFTLPHEPGR